VNGAFTPGPTVSPLPFTNDLSLDSNRVYKIIRFRDHLIEVFVHVQIAAA